MPSPTTPRKARCYEANSCVVGKPDKFVLVLGAAHNRVVLNERP